MQQVVAGWLYPGGALDEKSLAIEALLSSLHSILPAVVPDDGIGDLDSSSSTLEASLRAFV